MCPHVICIVKAPSTHTHALVILDFLGRNVNKLKNSAHPLFAIVMVSVQVVYHRFVSASVIGMVKIVLIVWVMVITVT